MPTESCRLGPFRLGPWTVDPRSGEIHDGALRRRIEPRPMAVLLHLAQRAGTVVSKDELLDAVWHDACVGEDSVWRAISSLRKALAHDDGDRDNDGDNDGDTTDTDTDTDTDTELIETVPRRGYRLRDAVGPSETRPRETRPSETTRRTSRWTPLAWPALVLVVLLAVRSDRPLADAPGEAPRTTHETTREATHEATREAQGPADTDLARGRAELAALPLANLVDDPALDRAAAFFDRAVARDPGSAAAHAALADARALLVRRDALPTSALDEAERLAQRALALDPELAAGHRSLARIASLRGRVDDAAAGYRRALALDPDDLLALEGLAHAATLRGALGDALRLLRELTRRAPHRAGLWTRRGWTELLLGATDAAANSFGRALALEPFDPVATVGLARLDLQRGEREVARARLRAAARVHPRTPELITSLGIAAQQDGDFRAAEAAYRHALTVGERDDVEAALRLTQVLRLRGDEAEAHALSQQVEQRARRGLERRVDSPLPHVVLAMAAAVDARPDDAAAHLEQAVARGYADLDTLRTDLLFAELHGAPRFEQILRHLDATRRDAWRTLDKAEPAQAS